MPELEIWKDIEPYSGLYQVSNLGRVKSYKYTRPRILKLNHNNKTGYDSVTLTLHGIQKRFTIHRLVAEAFLENPNNLPMVNHKDEVKTNNCASNLEWCDAIYNSNYGSCREKLSIAAKKRKPTNTGKRFYEGNSITSVLCVETNTIYPSIKLASIDTNTPCSNISACCRGKQKTARNYHWVYSA